jgi:hypothetical protein
MDCSRSLSPTSPTLFGCCSTQESEGQELLFVKLSLTLQRTARGNPSLSAGEAAKGAESERSAARKEGPEASPGPPSLQPALPGPVTVCVGATRALPLDPTLLGGEALGLYDGGAFLPPGSELLVRLRAPFRAPYHPHPLTGGARATQEAP